MTIIPDPLLRALADRPASRICENILVRAHEEDIRNLLERCAQGRTLDYRLKHEDRFKGVLSIHLNPKSFLASVRFEAPVEISGMRLVFLQAIPQTVLTRLGTDTDARQVVDHPFLDGLRIKGIRVDGKCTRIVLKSIRKRRTLGQVLTDHPCAIEEGWKPGPSDQARSSGENTMDCQEGKSR